MSTNNVEGEDISKAVSFFDCLRKNGPGVKMDYVFNFLLHLPNFFHLLAKIWNRLAACGHKNICALCGGGGAGYFEGKTRKSRECKGRMDRRKLHRGAFVSR